MSSQATQTGSYRELLVWQKAMDLVEATYRLAKQFPASERFGLTSQMQRAAVSVPAHAEGIGQAGQREGGDPRRPAQPGRRSATAVPGRSPIPAARNPTANQKIRLGCITVCSSRFRIYSPYRGFLFSLMYRVPPQKGPDGEGSTTKKPAPGESIGPHPETPAWNVNPNAAATHRPMHAGW